VSRLELHDVVKHYPQAAEMADRVLTLRDGRLSTYEREHPARPGWAGPVLARHG
jgi:ABC-type protease/lipase transport system fused ATPase/permease subunit